MHLDHRNGEIFEQIPDDWLLNVYPYYDIVSIDDNVTNLDYLEVDFTGQLLAVVGTDGIISIWECVEEKWVRQSSWRCKDFQRQDDTENGQKRCGTRSNIIARWCHYKHGKYLGVALDTQRRVHIFGENDNSSLNAKLSINVKKQEPLVRWHREHSMYSAGNITEMRFSPAHLDLRLVTGTSEGMVVIHQIENKQWYPHHAISVFSGYPITSLTWNQNPIHELPILVASTNAIDAPITKRIAVFATNSYAVRPETNMCFDASSYVNCVAFAPSNGLNGSLLAVGLGRRICLYVLTVEEVKLGLTDFDENAEMDEEEVEEREYVENGVDAMTNGGENLPLPQRHLEELTEEAAGSPQRQMTPSPRSSVANVSHLHVVGSVTSNDSDSSPALPPNFFGDRDAANNGAFDEADAEDSTDTEEEKEPEDGGTKALKWDVKWLAVFRETSAVKSIQWNKHPTGFTAQFADGKIRSYKWSFGCVWAKSAELALREPATLSGRIPSGGGHF